MHQKRQPQFSGCLYQSNYGRRVAYLQDKSKRWWLVKTSFTFSPSITYALFGNITEPESKNEYNKIFAMDIFTLKISHISAENKDQFSADRGVREN
jgi:hypothetical protein